MEEILASIRRIISEDEAAAGPQTEADHAAVEEDILELTDRLDDEPREPETPVAPAPVAEFAPARAAEPVAPEGGLVSPSAADSAASAFGRLERSVTPPAPAAAEARSLEDVVGDLLRPMLKAWLDENLPGIVRAAVEAEVERIARLRR